MLGFTWLLAWDEHFTFVRTDRGALIESRADGVLGFVPPPLEFTVYDPTGFLIATRGEESLRAPIARATELAAYVPFGAPGRVVDHEGKTWLAVAGEHLLRSNDGTSWEQATHPIRVRDVRVRGDGTIVLATVTGGLVVVGPKGDARPATLQVNDPTLLRWDNWIVAARPFELTHADPGFAVLASDGKSWVTSAPPKDQGGAGFVQLVDNWLGYATRLGKERWARTRAEEAADKAALQAADRCRGRRHGEYARDGARLRRAGLPRCGLLRVQVIAADGGRADPPLLPGCALRQRCGLRSWALCARAAGWHLPTQFDSSDAHPPRDRRLSAGWPRGRAWTGSARLSHAPARAHTKRLGGGIGADLSERQLAELYDSSGWHSHRRWRRQRRTTPRRMAAATARARRAWREVTLPNARWYATLAGGRAAVVTSNDGNRLELGGRRPRGAADTACHRRAHGPAQQRPRGRPHGRADGQR